MAAYDLPYCCCGCSLRSGVLFAGWYSLISALFSLIFVVISASDMSAMGCNYYGPQIAAICVAAFFANSILIRGVLTLYGAHTDDISMLWVAMYLHLIIGIFVLVVIVFYLILLIFHALIFIFDVFFHCYFVLVFRSYCLELKAKQEIAESSWKA